MIRHVRPTSQVSPSRGIHLVTGPMFSGKSANLIAWIRERERHGTRVLVVVPQVAAGFEGPFVTSHDGDRVEAIVVASAAQLERLPTAAALAIDEAQFLKDEIAEVLVRLSRRGTEMGVAGLDRDFRGRPFASTVAIENVAGAVDRLTARCAVCGGEASLTQRLVDGRPAPADEEVIRPGDEHLYEPRCRSCFVRLPDY